MVNSPFVVSGIKKKYTCTMRKTKTIVLLVILVLFVGQATAATGVGENFIPKFLGSTFSSASQSQQDEIATNMQKLELLYRLVARDFLFDIDHNAVYESMAKGLFSGLDDKYSAYILSKDAADFSEDTSGTYGGIGAYISKHYLEYRDFSKPETYMVSITSVFPGSPAEKAGLRSGDLISHIDGEPVDSMEAQEASRALKGKSDTEVILTILRGQSTFDVTVVRKIVTVPTVSADILEGDIGYLRITQFTNSTAQQVHKELLTFLEEDVKAIILDLRDNPGGIVDSTLSVADMFLSEDTIVHVRGKNADHDQTLKANKGSLVPSTMPLVTLVNKGSASASEILAGALQDNKRSPLIGSQTFGKGLIQIVSPFGDGYYTLTTSQYKTPSGAEIHTVGIPVDIEVDDVYIADDEMEAYLEFTNSGVVEEFVAEHPGFSFENVQLFLDSVVGEDPPFGKEVYRLLVRREYLNAIPYEERPIADVEFDPVLKEAIEYLNRSF